MPNGQKKQTFCTFLCGFGFDYELPAILKGFFSGLFVYTGVFQGILCQVIFLLGNHSLVTVFKANPLPFRSEILKRIIPLSPFHPLPPAPKHKTRVCPAGPIIGKNLDILISQPSISISQRSKKSCLSRQAYSLPNKVYHSVDARSIFLFL